ncbi:hypothetical protein JCGZ_12154 [Jatropha curcas]|uniref:Uncharacterized protein n=1 Tax=Jatropha curcas TaxID=180498 RepID=A0A067K9S2_JATCU|nr:hypothetical protein JCGZ_12154 [Jatropha curcas]
MWCQSNGEVLGTITPSNVEAMAQSPNPRHHYSIRCRSNGTVLGTVHVDRSKLGQSRAREVGQSGAWGIVPRGTTGQELGHSPDEPMVGRNQCGTIWQVCLRARVLPSGQAPGAPHGRSAAPDSKPVTEIDVTDKFREAEIF